MPYKDNNNNTSMAYYLGDYHTSFPSRFVEL